MKGVCWVTKQNSDKKLLGLDAFKKKKKKCFYTFKCVLKLQHLVYESRLLLLLNLILHISWKDTPTSETT